MTRRNLRAVLLDVDGTLIDSNDAHARTWVEALAKFGYEADFGVMRRSIGMGGDELMTELGIPNQPQLREKIEALRAALFRRELASLQPTPGVRELLDKLRQQALRRVVASSSPESQLRALLEQAGIADRVDATVSADDVARAKPAPDIFSAAMQKAGERSSTVVALGDTPHDLESARRAGVPLIALRCGGWDFEPREIAAWRGSPLPQESPSWRSPRSRWPSTTTRPSWSLTGRRAPWRNSLR